jgi:thymidylate kinase
LKVCIVFEGRDGAGKGGTIKAITERVSPRVFRVVALPAPTEKEKVSSISSVMCPTCLRRVKSLSSIAAGTTGQVLNG